MIFHKKVLGFILLAGGFLILWIISRDFLLLSLWIAILILLLASFLWTKTSINKLSLRRFSRIKVLKAGEIFSERLEIKNNGRQARYLLQIEDQSGLLAEVHSRAVSRLGAGEVRVQSVKALMTRRGFYSLGPTRVSTGDPFGFFTAYITFPPEKQLTVFPYIPSMAGRLSSGGRHSGEQNLLERSIQPTPQAWGVREYQPGDALNRVHWPLTMKKGALMVKEYDRDTQANVWILLDVLEGLYTRFGSYSAPALDWNLVSLKERRKYQLPKDGFEYAVSTAASLCEYYLSSGQPLGFASNGRRSTILPAEKGTRQLNKILFHLAGIKNNGELDIVNLLNQQAKNIARGNLLFIVTGANSKLFSQSTQLTRHWGLNLSFIQIDADSFASKPDVKRETSSNKNIIRIGYEDDISEILSNRIGATYRKAGFGGSLPQPNPRG